MAVPSATLEAVDFVVQSVGGALALGLAVLAVRSGEWRKPLPSLTPNSRGPTGLAVVITLGAYLLFAAVARNLAQVSNEGMQIVGSPHWLLAMRVDGGAKLLLAGGLIALLAFYRPLIVETWTTPSHVRRILGGVAAGLISLPICNLLLWGTQELWKRFDPGAAPPAHEVLQAIQRAGPGIVPEMFVIAVCIAPLVEELFFRGLLLHAVWRFSGRRDLAVGVSALAFACVHLPQPQAVFPLFVLGVILGVARLRLRSLTACVIAHVVFNGRTMVLLLLNPELAHAV